MAAEIVVSREPTEWRDRVRAYKLVVDGEVRASVGQGDTCRVEVDPGHHRVWMRLDWGRSQIVDVATPDGHRAVLDCRANNNDPALLLLTLSRTRYIELELQAVEPIDKPLVADVSLAPVGAKPPTAPMIGLGVLFGAVLIGALAGWATHSVSVFVGVVVVGVVVSLVFRMARR